MENGTTEIHGATAEVRIVLPQRFTFHDHRKFREGYAQTPAQATHYVVDFNATRFIDSAGLGMLLQLAEYALSDPRRIRLVNCTREIRETLEVAGFGDVATIA